MRHRAAGKPRPRPPRHHRHPKLVAVAQHIDDLPLGFRQADGHRQLAVGGQAVALVGPQIFFVNQQAMGRQDHLQAPGQRATISLENGFG